MKPVKRLGLIVLTVPVILLIPLAGTLLSSEVQWDMADFLIMGSMLLGAGLVLECIIRKVPNKNARILGVILLILVVLLLWVELAVGLFGSPLAGN